MRVYEKLGVAISWVECKSARTKAEADLRCQDSPSATHLNLRIVQHASKASDGVFGVAFLSAKNWRIHRRILQLGGELDRRMALSVSHEY